ncbi:MAG: hypothetical protein R3C60_02540 [Parvularculaceae bacterium]
MIRTIKKLLKPSKAHRLGLDYSAEAEAMFRRIASDLGLEIVKEPSDPVELSMTIPQQENLSSPIWVCLQNLDELWFAADGFTYSRFPFEEVKDEFETVLRRFLLGECRVLKHVRQKDKKPFKFILQYHKNGNWQSMYEYNRMISLFPIRNFAIIDEYPNRQSPTGELR